MIGQPRSYIKLTGCGHCGQKSPQNRCPCRSQYFCNRTCQRRHWRKHKKDCGLFSKDGQDLEDADIRAWGDKNGQAILDGLREEHGLSDPGKSEQLFDTFVVIVLDFIPASTSKEAQFSHSKNELFKISEAMVEGIELNGTYYGIEQIAKDIRAAQLKTKASGRAPPFYGVFFSRYCPPGAEHSNYVASIVEIDSIAPQKTMTCNTFRVYHGDPEKTTKMMSEMVESTGVPKGSVHSLPSLETWTPSRRDIAWFADVLLSSSLAGLNKWLAIKAGDLSEIFTQEMNLFDVSNRTKIDETACIIELDYDPALSNPTDRFKIARLVGCFSFEELSSPPSFETDEWSLHVETAIQGRAHRIRIQNLPSDHVLFCFIVLIPVEPWSLVTHIDGPKDAVGDVELDPNWRKRLLGEVASG